MRIFFYDDKPIELAIEPEILWGMWSAVKHGMAEIKIRVPFGRGGHILYDLGRIDAGRTFQEIPPPPDTLKAPPPSCDGEGDE